MADAIGEPKISETGPGAGPKRHPLKQTSPVKAREYYTSKGPGTTSHKPKIPSRSPSVEPTDHSDTNNLSSRTTVIQPQDNNGDSTDRPMMPISNTPPPTETTPCAQRTITQTSKHTEEDEFMEPKTLDTDVAVAAAAEHNLDFVMINVRMFNVLLDVDDIMYNHLLDIFDLPQWVANVTTLFRLRLCDEQEWKDFSNHYDCETGVVTASKPRYETINPTNDTAMPDVDRDELSKARMELTMVNTTIKNLSEAVVNFS